MKHYKKVALATVLFSIYTGAANAHLLAFNKLSPTNKHAKVVTSFELNEQEIIKQFHFRSKFFEVEKWMVSQNVVLTDNHYHGQHANTVATKNQQKALQTHSEIEIDKDPVVHDLIDPFYMTISNSSSNNGNTQQANNAVNKINIAGFVAVSMCNAYSSINIKNNMQNLVPRFKAPLSFVQGMVPKNSDNSNYDLSQGIAFDCVYHTRAVKPIVRKRAKSIKALPSASKLKYDNKGH